MPLLQSICYLFELKHRVLNEITCEMTSCRWSLLSIIFYILLLYSKILVFARRVNSPCFKIELCKTYSEYHFQYSYQWKFIYSCITNLMKREQDSAQSYSCKFQKQNRSGSKGVKQYHNISVYTRNFVRSLGLLCEPYLPKLRGAER